MPLDPNIILAGRPAPIENPMQMYSQMLSARALQQQSAIQQQQAQQQQTLYPYQQQQQQAAAQEAQIRVRQAQQAQQDQQAIGEALRRQAQATPDGQFQGTGDDAIYRQAPPGTGADAIERDAPKGTGTDQGIYRQLPATGGGAPAYGSHPIDLMKAGEDAFNSGGLSYAGYAEYQKQVLAHRQELAKTSTEELKATNARHDEYLGRLAAFRSESPEYQQNNWKNFNQQAYTDGLLNSSEYSATISQHPELPDSQTLDAYQLGMQTLSGQQAAALKLQQANTAKARQTAAESAAKISAAKLPEVQAQADQAVRANQTAILATATDADDYEAKLAQLPPGDAAKYGYPDPEDWDPKQTPAQLRQMGQTSEQQVTSGATAATRAQTAAHEQTMEAQGWQRIAIQKARAGAGGLTPVQTLRETDAISKQEFGLHQERIDIGTKLTGGFAVDKNGNPTKTPLSPQLRGQIQGRLQLINGQLQQVQARKASLMGVTAPPQSVIDNMPEGQPVNSPDGHTWKKQDGIAYFVQ